MNCSLTSCSKQIDGEKDAGTKKKKKWYGTYTDKPDGSWNQSGREYGGKFLRIRSSNILCLQCLRGELRSKRGSKKAIHFNGSHENIELLLRTVIHLEKMEIPTGLSTAENSTNAQQRENPMQEYGRKFKHLSEDQKLTKLCSDAGLKLVKKRQHFKTLDTEEAQQMQHFCREFTMPHNEQGARIRG